MTRTSLTIGEQAGFPEAGTELTFVAADTANGNRLLASGGEVIFARNVGLSSRTVTFSYHRRGQLITQTAVSIAAGKTKMFGPFVEEMLNHDPVDAGQVYVTASHADVEFAARRQLAGYGPPLYVTSGSVLILDGEYAPAAGVWEDRSGRENHCAVTGTGWAQVDGNCIEFDGTGSWDFTVTDDADFDFSGDFTIEVWATLDVSGVTSDGLIVKRAVGSSGTGAWGLSAEAFQNQETLATYFYPQVLPTMTQVIVTRTGSSLSLYIDGVLFSTNTDATNFSSTFPIRIAVWDNGGVFPLNGKIGLIAMYNRALTATERAQNLGAMNYRF